MPNPPSDSIPNAPASPSASPSACRPLFSVVMSTRGRHRVFERAAQSVLAQVGVDFELVVVSDGPDTVKRQWCMRDRRILYDELDPPRGDTGNPAKRHGCRIARGHWITFLDDDDLYTSPNALLTIADRLPFDMAVWTVRTPWSDISAQTLVQMPQANFPAMCSGIQFAVRSDVVRRNPWPDQIAHASPVFYKNAYLATFGGPVVAPPTLAVIDEPLTSAYAAIRVDLGERLHTYDDQALEAARG